MSKIPSFPDSLNKAFEDGSSLRSEGYRGRFAPTPSGYLHFGNLRTALISWLKARLSKGKFFLRFDDLDFPRIKEGSIESIKYDLLWLGLDWDHPTIFQSKRLDFYQNVLSALKKQGKLYECECSRKIISQRNLSKSKFFSCACKYKKNFLYTKGRKSLSWRLNVGNEYANLCEDVIVRRSDGLSSYNFATVIDELTLGITEVIRGEDLAKAISSQLSIFSALGQNPISYKYVPLMLNSEGKKLSKRNKDHSLSFYRDKGLSSSNVVGILASSLKLVPTGSKLSAKELLNHLELDDSSFKDVFLNSGDIQR